MTIAVNGIKINCKMTGTGDVVLFLHGWGANMGLFDKLMTAVSEKYTALALDLPGFGGSEEPPEPWSVDDYVKFVNAFLDELGVKPVCLVGHSFGGRIMIKELSGNLLPSVSKAVFIDAAGIKPKKTLKQNLSLAAYKAGKAVLSFKPIKALFPNALDNLRNKRGSADYKNSTPTMRATLVKVVNEDLTELLPKINIPSLLIWGTADTATPISDGETFEKLIPNAGLVRVNGAGHYSFLQAPELTERAIRSFLGIPL
ncbi:MAG: alpha/beta hydrolase [Ruminococcus sp.]|nr:alpha/beta hydrolase [Ruminococcus sp.]